MANLTPLLDRLDNLAVGDISRLQDQELLALAEQLLDLQAQDRKYNQLRYYQPASQRALAIHTSTARTLGVGGGNGSSKTDTSLVEMVIRCTGQIPLCLKEMYPREKLRGPIAARVVVESLTTTLFPIILPKLQWYKWQGVDIAGGKRGHWGWIPKDCLIQGDWDKSWKSHERILRLYYRDPLTHEIAGESSIQFMSYDQDPSDFASGDFHFILHDEPPKEAIWVENMARTMRVDGTMMVAMTWPDDPTIAVDWILDRVYEPAQPGKNKNKDIDWINLVTTENMNLNQDAIARTAGMMSLAERSSRIYGLPIKLSNRVHPLFTEDEHKWCFSCHDLAITTESGLCGRCGAAGVIKFTHVEHLVPQATYPVIQLMDPHPRKPHFLMWIQITPNDDWEQIRELEINEPPHIVWQEVQRIESDYGWGDVHRLMDPNMGRSPSSSDRETTWQDAFDQVGMRMDLADDGEPGRHLVNDMLKPCEDTGRPRYTCDISCTKTIYQMKRFAFDDYKKSIEKDQKQAVKKKHDDAPACLRYAANSHPSFRGLKMMGSPIQRVGQRKRGY